MVLENCRAMRGSALGHTYSSWLSYWKWSENKSPKSGKSNQIGSEIIINRLWSIPEHCWTITNRFRWFPGIVRSIIHISGQFPLVLDGFPIDFPCRPSMELPVAKSSSKSDFHLHVFGGVLRDLEEMNQKSFLYVFYSCYEKSKNGI